jgi:hypothetical protein
VDAANGDRLSERCVRDKPQSSMRSTMSGWHGSGTGLEDSEGGNDSEAVVRASCRSKCAEMKEDLSADWLAGADRHAEKDKQ